jgi:hypothetical protein
MMYCLYSDVNCASLSEKTNEEKDVKCSVMFSFPAPLPSVPYSSLLTSGTAILSL